MSLCSVTGCVRTVASRGMCEKHYTRWRRHGDPTHSAFGRAVDYLNKVVLKYKNDDCLIWPFGRGTKGGYGKIRIWGKKYDTHRVVCIMVYGLPPTDKHWVAHLCGNGNLGCVNPKHLRWSTPKENHADKIIHGTVNRGERNGNSKMTKKDVIEIRKSSGPHKLTAKRFGISPATVSDIKKGKRWGWL